METSFLDLLVSLLGGGSLKLKASGSDITDIHDLRPSVTQLQSSDRRNIGGCVEGSMCMVEVGTAEWRGAVLGHLWSLQLLSTWAPCTGQEAVYRRVCNSYWGKHSFINSTNVFWVHTMWQALSTAWVHGTDQKWSPYSLHPTPLSKLWTLSHTHIHLCY